MDYLAKNLAALSKTQPELAARLTGVAAHPDAVIETSRGGPPTLRLAGQLQCSAVDPAAEGRQMAAGAPDGPLAVLGFGLGYHLEPLADRDLLVWEPDAGLLAAALAARDMSGWLGRVCLSVDLPAPERLAGRGLLLHRPTARRWPEAAAALERLAAAPARPAWPANPRVLLMPPIMGGSLPVALWCAQALEQLGCQVRTLPVAAIRPLYDVVRHSGQPQTRLDRVLAPLTGFFAELVMLAAEDFQPQLFLALAQAPLHPRALAAMRAQGVATAFWFIENHRIFDYFRDIAPSYDHFFHIQGAAMDRLLGRLGANGHHLPVAAHPPRHRPVALDDDDRATFGADVGFMGSGAYLNRRRFLAELLEHGRRPRIWGTEWPDHGPLAALVALNGRRLNDEEVVKVYNACHIVLNLHSAEDPDAEVGQSDFINPRTFEAPACGGFQLVDRAAGLAEAFDLGRELVVFDNVADLADKIGHYLAHPDQREAIALAGQRRVLAEHTYFHRMRAILQTCLGRQAN